MIHDKPNGRAGSDGHVPVAVVCQFCKWFLKSGVSLDLGECHRQPPAVVVLPNVRGQNPPFVIGSAWPAVKLSNFCGEWKYDGPEP